MKKYPAIPLFLAALLPVPLPGQYTAPAPGQPAAVAANDTNAPLKLRRELAEALIKGTEKTAGALSRLKACPSASGLKLDSGADFAFAAIDVGQRLIAGGRPTEAEIFFREAEQSLALAVKHTPDTAARDKAMLLRRLSFIRGRYLNQVAQAKADIEQAMALQPDDQGLQVARASLASENADYFRAQPKK
jgi:hypothetical protein